jgi:hypothetical protein
MFPLMDCFVYVCMCDEHLPIVCVLAESYCHLQVVNFLIR